MSRSPTPLEYARSAGPSTWRRVVPWALTSIHLGSLGASIALMVQTLPSRGWDRFALVVIGWVLLGAQFLLLAGTGVYAHMARQRSWILWTAVVLGASAAVTSATTLVLAYA